MKLIACLRVSFGFLTWQASIFFNFFSNTPQVINQCLQERKRKGKEKKNLNQFNI
jgi:hypothetical protein